MTEIPESNSVPVTRETAVPEFGTVLRKTSRGRRIIGKGDAKPIPSPLTELIDAARQEDDPAFNYYSVSEGTALRSGPFTDDEQTESQAMEWGAETNMRVRTLKKALRVPRGGHLFYHVQKTSANGEPLNPTENYSSSVGQFWIAQELDPKTHQPKKGWARYPLRRRGR